MSRQAKLTIQRPLGILLGLSILVTACTPEKSTDGDTAVPPSSASYVKQPTPTHRLSATPITVTATMPPTPTPELPDIITDDFLFDGLTPKCQLPCWRGLRIDQSTAEDVGHVLGDALVFDPTSITDDTPGITTFPGHMSKVHNWIFGYTYAETLAIRAIFDEASLTLRGMEFYWSYRGFYPTLTPQRFIQELGVPAYILADLKETGHLGWQAFYIVMVYEPGVVLYRETAVPVDVETSWGEGGQHVDKAILELCFGGQVWEYHEDISIMTGEVLILQPFTNGLDDLTPSQEWSIRYLPRTLDLFSPIQDKLGFTLEQIAEVALLEGDACLYKDLTDEYNR